MTDLVILCSIQIGHTFLSNQYCYFRNLANLFFNRKFVKHSYR